VSSFGSLNTALTGIMTARTGLDTTSHNISNANTKGYTRQRVDQSARLPLATQDGFIGTGAQVDRIGRARDAFLDARVRTGARTLGEVAQRSEMLARAEQVMAEPDQGITAAVGDVWSAWEDLALNPPDTAARTTVIESLANMSARVRAVSGGWDQLEADASVHMSVLVDDVNSTLHHVAELNDQIRDQSAAGGEPNDLMDQRDLLLDELAQKVGANFTHVDDGTVRVTINGLSLVDANHVSELTLDETTHTLSHPSGAAFQVGGEIAGNQRFLTQDLPGLRQALDTWVVDYSAALNAQHAAGTRPPGVAGGALLTYNAATPAATLDVAFTDPNLVAASKVPYAEFDGDNAQAIAALRNDATLALGGTETLDGGIRTLVAGLGGRVAELERSARTEEDLLGAAELTRQGQHGVSLDEEMVLMLQYQHSYSAASRVMTTIDQTLDTLINRTGIVGR
jgi:flagellar hook-associated protein 1